MDHLSTPRHSSGGARTPFQIVGTETPTTASPAGRTPVATRRADLFRTPSSAVMFTPKVPKFTPRSSGGGKRSSTGKPGEGGARKKLATPNSRLFTPLTVSAPKNAFAVSLIESRNKRQIGVAALNLRTPELDMYIFTDNQTYANTLRLIHMYDPFEIMVSDTAVGTNLYTILNDQFQLSKINTYQRKYFNEDHGQLQIEQKATKESLSLLTLDATLFLCLAATNCLLKWSSFEQSETYAPNSIKVTLKTLEGHMALSMSTIKSLEVLTNALDAKAKKGSLLSTLNMCKTPLGEKLLRSSLMLPLTHIATITTRQNGVEELLSKEDVFFDLIAQLPHFASLDLLINGLAMVPHEPSERTAQQGIMNILFLKQILKAIPGVIAALEGCESNILSIIATKLSDPKREGILEQIDEVISEESGNISQKSSSSLLHSRLAFAVVSGLHGLLDIARATYFELVDSIHETIQGHMEVTPNLKKNFNVTRGFYLSLPIAAEENLSPEFIQITRQGKRINFSTAALISMDNRRKEAFGEVLLLTVKLLQDLSCTIRKNMHWLFDIAEAIALLDMLVAFANVASSNEAYTRPTLTEDGPIAISKGRHPVKELNCSQVFTPNDVFLTETSHLQIVTGPNGSGKSTFLRQVGLIVIMAHIGCFVPADYACIPCVDQIFSRMSHGDDLEGNASGFLVEAREAAYIVRNITAKSLVLIDELGRSTSTVDGVGIAWAVVEVMLAKGTFALFATHFHELTDLPLLYPKIKNVQLQVAHEDSRVNFCYSVGEGACQEVVNQYGIYIAELAMFPSELIDRARSISTQLRREFNISTASNPSTSCYYETIQKLLALKHCSLDSSEIRLYLQKIRDEMFEDSEMLEEDGGDDFRSDQPGSSEDPIQSAST